MSVSVEDIINAALRRIRYPVPIGSIFEGSMASRVALDVYGQTRDDAFGSADWSFLRREVSLGAPIKTAPPGGYGINPWDPAVNPPIPWRYSYTYPDECVEIRSLRPIPVFIPEFTPMFTRFVTAQDSVSGNKVVLTNLYQPLAIMTGQINDPSEWKDSNFTETLIDALAVRFEKSELGRGDVNQINLAERDAAQSSELAQSRRG